MDKPEHAIQPLPALPAHATKIALPPSSGLRTLPSTLFFGAVSGAMFGPLITGAGCWLADQLDFLWLWAGIGALIGACGGLMIAFVERKLRGDVVKPDIATIVGVLYGLLPAILMLMGSLAVGMFSILLAVGLACIGPMVGLLIGAMLDRAFEALIQKSWGLALRCSTTATAVCLGLLVAISYIPTYPEPEEVARSVRLSIAYNWRFDPAFDKLKIRKVFLEYKGRQTYEGFIDTSLDDQKQRWNLTVVHEQGSYRWEIAPQAE